MDNNRLNSTLSQVLSLVPFDKLPSLPLHSLDVGVHKLFTISLLRIFVAADVRGWKSYSSIEEGIRADPEFQKELGIHSISGSQLSRRITQVPTELLQTLFTEMMAMIQERCEGFVGVTQRIGRLRIVDASKIHLPFNLCEWARVSLTECGVKIHAGLLVVDKGITYPDAIVVSTSAVDDRKGADRLVTETDATYVMDRGYEDYRRMDEWIRSGVRFAVRIRQRSSVTVVEEFPVSTGSNILRDARVRLGSKFRRMEEEIRLVEFVDERGRRYLVVTNRMDLTAEEIAQVYKHRWLIELFFKWVKQHLPSTKIHSTTAQGVWNEIFLAMIAYAASLYVKLITGTKKTQWQVLDLIRHYAEKSWKAFMVALERKPSRPSKGRRRVENPPPKPVELRPSDIVLVGKK